MCCSIFLIKHRHQHQITKFIFYLKKYDDKFLGFCQSLLFKQLETFLIKTYMNNI